MMLPMVSLPFRRFRPFRRNSEPPEEDINGENNQPEPESEQFYPNLWDVLKTRYVLRWKLVPDGLPVEIVDLIVDAAEYWPSTVATMDKSTTVRSDKDRVVLKSVPLCYDEKTLSSSSPKLLPHRTIHPCRKVVFSISAHDQGWGGHRVNDSPFSGAFTWFTTEIVPHTPPSSEDSTEEPGNAPPQRYGNDHPHFLPNASKLQSNETAEGDTQHHTIIWHHLDNITVDSPEAEQIEHSEGRGKGTLDGSQVRGLEIGQSIAVWARARFPGWSNHVEEASIRVFWSV